MQERDIQIAAREGLHLRVAGGVVSIVKAHHSKVSLCQDCRQADGCSILQILLLAAEQGTAVTVRVEGPDEGVVIEKISEHFTNGGGI